MSKSLAKLLKHVRVMTNLYRANLDLCSYDILEKDAPRRGQRKGIGPEEAKEMFSHNMKFGVFYP